MLKNWFNFVIGCMVRLIQVWYRMKDRWKKRTVDQRIVDNVAKDSSVGERAWIGEVACVPSGRVSATTEVQVQSAYFDYLFCFIRMFCMS